MVHGTNATCQADKEGGDAVTNPDANPSLPPREAIGQRRCCNHPSVDVERIGNPKVDKVAMFPQSPLWLDRLQIQVRQEQLLVGETRFSFTFLD